MCTKCCHHCTSGGLPSFWQPAPGEGCIESGWRMGWRGTLYRGRAWSEVFTWYGHMLSYVLPQPALRNKSLSGCLWKAYVIQACRIFSLQFHNVMCRTTDIRRTQWVTEMKQSSQKGCHLEIILILRSFSPINVLNQSLPNVYQMLSSLHQRGSSFFLTTSSRRRLYWEWMKNGVEGHAVQGQSVEWSLYVVWSHAVLCITTASFT